MEVKFEKKIVNYIWPNLFLKWSFKRVWCKLAGIQIILALFMSCFTNKVLFFCGVKRSKGHHGKPLHKLRCFDLPTVKKIIIDQSKSKENFTKCFGWAFVEQL